MPLAAGSNCAAREKTFVVGRRGRGKVLARPLASNSARLNFTLSPHNFHALVESCSHNRRGYIAWGIGDASIGHFPGHQSRLVAPPLSTGAALYARPGAEVVRASRPIARPSESCRFGGMASGAADSPAKVESAALVLQPHPAGHNPRKKPLPAGIGNQPPPRAKTFVTDRRERARG